MADTSGSWLAPYSRSWSLSPIKGRSCASADSLGVRAKRGARRPGFGGFIPYLFGCYLVFYEGLWRLGALLDGFSSVVVVVALLYIVTGYTVVLAIYRVNMLGRTIGKVMSS